MRRAGVVLACAVLAAAAGCGRERAPDPPLPELAAAEPQVARAITEAAARARSEPESAEAWGALGRVLDAHGFLAEAATCYRQAAALAPEAFDWSYDLAFVLELQGGDASETDRFLDRAAELRPDYAALHYVRGMVAGRRGDAAASLRHYEQAIATDPGFAAGHRALGQLAISSGDAAAAVRHLERAVALDPRDGAAFVSLARALALAGQPDRARRAERHARGLPPGARVDDPVRAAVAALNASSTALAARGRVALDAGRHAEALALFLEADQRKPGSANIQYNLGVCYLRTGELALAEARFRDAVAIGDDAEAHWRLGVMALARGERDAAAAELDRAAERAPDDGALLAQVATALSQAGRPEESLAWFERAIGLGADGAGSFNNWGAALLQLGRTDEALARFRRAMDVDPDDPDAFLNAGRALEHLGRTREAEALYGRALVLDPDGPARQRLEALAQR